MTLSLEDLEFRLNKIYALVEPLGSPGVGTRALKKNSSAAGDYSWHPSLDPDAVSDGSGTLVGIAISALPAAGALTGTELVPIVQGGVTSRTTTQDIADLGSGSGGSFWQYGVTGADILDIEAATQATMERFLVHVDNAGGILGLTVHDTASGSNYELGVTLGAFGPRTGTGGSPLSGTLDLTSESLTSGAYSEMFMDSSSNAGFRASDQISANGDYEAYHDQFADNSSAWFEFIAIGPSSNHYIDFDVVSTGGEVYVNIFGRNDSAQDPYILFGGTGSSNKFDVAPDTALVATGQWSMGYDQTTNTFTIKVHDSGGGGIKTWTVNPT